MKNRYFDLKKNQFVDENIYADLFLSFCYQSFYGKLLTRFVFSRPIINKLYGWYKSHAMSRNQIEKDIKNFHLDLNDYKKENYSSYRDFFLRQFAPNKRPFDADKNAFNSFCEGKYFIFNNVATDQISLPVKGQFLSPQELLQNEEWSKKFPEASVVICRLCPIDYHYFHYPFSGKTLSCYEIAGSYHSVNLLALKHKNDVFCTNHRRISILQSETFGLVAYIEVGAMCVGKILQTHPGDNFHQGEMKGHFDFGASTVIVITQKNQVQWNELILKNSREGYETQVLLGQTLGHKLS